MDSWAGVDLRMRSWMEYLEEQFLSYVGWNIDDSYANITLASQSVLNIDIPHGASVHVASQTTPHSFATQSLSNFSQLNGSVAYLYTSCPQLNETSATVPLQNLVQCYRRYPVTDVQIPPKKGAFMFGRMYIPGQQLEASFIQSISQRSQLLAKWVVDPRLPSPIILTASWQSHNKAWTRELLYSTHENLVGFRCQSNLGTWTEPEGTSRLVTGMEVFYAATKKSPGVSAGVRYSSHSRYSAVPLTLTLITNPIVGSVSAAYTLQPTPLSAFSTRFDFNLYSYMSDLTIGCELWRSSPVSLRSSAVHTNRKGPVSAIKATTSLASQTAKLLWEGSVRDFLVSGGVQFCYGDRAVPISTGFEVSYVS